MRVSQRSARLALAVLVLVIFLPIRLLAHAVLVDSSPKAGATVKGPDLTISLLFNVRVDGTRSRCTLVLPDGTTKSLPLETQAKPEMLTGKATGLVAGKYKLQWQVLAADGHISRGELPFTVE